VGTVKLILNRGIDKHPLQQISNSSHDYGIIDEGKLPISSWSRKILSKFRLEDNI